MNYHYAISPEAFSPPGSDCTSPKGLNLLAGAPQAIWHKL
jgi:hypothetical protein